MVALVTGLDFLSHMVLSGTPLHRKTNKTKQDLQREISEGHTLMQYIRAAAEANIHLTLRDLRETGFSARELVDTYGYTIAELRSAGYTASELLSSGINHYKLEAAGIVAPRPDQPLAPPPPPPPAPPPAPPPPPPPPPPVEKPLTTQEAIMVKMEKAGLDAKKLDMAGFTQDELRDIVGLNDSQLKTLGYTPSPKPPELSAKAEAEVAKASAEARAKFALKAQTSQAFSATQLKALGFSATELKAAGFNLTQLKKASFSAEELRLAQFSAGEMRAAGYSGHHLFRAGFTLVDLSLAGFDSSVVLKRGAPLPTVYLDARAARTRVSTNPTDIETANADRAATLSTNPTAQVTSTQSSASPNSTRYNPSSFSTAEDPQAYSAITDAPNMNTNESLGMEPSHKP